MADPYLEFISNYKNRYKTLEMVDGSGLICDELGPLEGKLEGKVPKGWLPEPFTIRDHSSVNNPLGSAGKLFRLVSDSGREIQFAAFESAAEEISKKLDLNDPSELNGKSVVAYFSPETKDKKGTTLVSFI